MCPPFEIDGKKRTIVAKRGYFEVSRNRIQYKLGNNVKALLVLSPTDATGLVTELPPYSELNHLEILAGLCRGMSELCFLPETDDNSLEFLFGNLLPFTINEYDLFYSLREFPTNIFEHFYRSSVSLEDNMSNTIETFSDNIYIPFKQRVVSTLSQNSDKESKSDMALKLVSKEFSRFLGLQNDLITILRNQSKQISENQQLSFSVISPILRKTRLLTTLWKFMNIKLKKGSMTIDFNPISLDTQLVIDKIAPHITLS